MTKVVYNNCYGGFSLSEKAIARYKEIKGSISEQFYDRDIDRDDPALVQVVEELGKGANGFLASLRIEDVPAGTKYRIDEYDGNENVMTVDDYEWKVA